MERAEQQQRPDTAPRELVRPGRAGAGIATALFLIVLANWSLHLQPTRYTSDFYDVQARRLFHGHLSVPLDRIGLEAFHHGNAYHLYFGIFPTLLRMPILLLTSRFDGRLTQPSMLAAWAVLLIAVRGLLWHTRLLVRGDLSSRPLDGVDRLMSFATPIVLVAATPVLFLASVTAVYHEAILWGLAATLWTFHRLLLVLNEPSRKAVLVFGLGATVAMTSRASVGLAPCASAIVVAVVALASNRTRGGSRWRHATARLRDAIGCGMLSTRNARLVLLAALVPIGIHVAVNEARFGTTISPPYASQVWTDISADRRAALAANGGSLFNVGYAPSTMLAYLRPDGAQLSRQFPYLWFDRPARVVGDVVFDTRDRTASLTSVSPLLVALSGAGAVIVAHAVIRGRRVARLALPAITSIGATVGVLTIGFIAQRYEGDLLLPALLLALPACLVVLDALFAPRIHRRLSTAASIALVVAVAWSMWANVSIAVLYQRLYVPSRDADRHRFIDLQLTMQSIAPGSIGYERGNEAPTGVAPPRHLHVTGDCRELWWSDGTIWIQLEPLASGQSPLCQRLVSQ